MGQEREVSSHRDGRIWKRGPTAGVARKSAPVERAGSSVEESGVGREEREEAGVGGAQRKRKQEPTGNTAKPREGRDKPGAWRGQLGAKRGQHARNGLAVAAEGALQMPKSKQRCRAGAAHNDRASDAQCAPCAHAPMLATCLRLLLIGPALVLTLAMSGHAPMAAALWAAYLAACMRVMVSPLRRMRPSAFRVFRLTAGVGQEGRSRFWASRLPAGAASHLVEVSNARPCSSVQGGQAASAHAVSCSPDTSSASSSTRFMYSSKPCNAEVDACESSARCRRTEARS